jgi:hypothetical protein
MSSAHPLGDCLSVRVTARARRERKNKQQIAWDWRERREKASNQAVFPLSFALFGFANQPYLDSLSINPLPLSLLLCCASYL